MALPAWAPWLFATLLLTLPAWAPFLRPDLNVAGLLDGDQHLTKAYSLAQLLAGGSILPRWTPELYGGYGYPTFVFYAPATYYLMVVLAAFVPHLGLYGAYQVVGAAAALGVVAGTYALGWVLWRHGPAATLGAGTAAYAPYLLQTNLFVRGAVPEVAGLALQVWLLFAVTSLWLAGTPIGGRMWWLTAALVGALLLTHNISAAVGAGLVVLWLGTLTLWRCLGGRAETSGPSGPSGHASGGAPPGAPGVAGIVLPAARLLAAAAVGALATAFFWLPAVTETGLVQVERMYRGNLNYHNWFITWPGFQAPLWGVQERSPWTPGWPFDLHLVYRHALYGAPRASLWQAVLVLGAVGSLVAWQASRRARRSAGIPRLSQDDRRPPAAVAVLYGVVLAVALYAQSFDWALPWWERYAALRAIQAPYRLLGPAAFAVAMAAGGTLAHWWRPGRAAAAVAVVVVGCLAVAGTAGRGVPVAPDLSRAADVAAAVDRQRAQPGGTASTDEFLPRSADFETWHEGEARGFWLYERLFPEASWLAGRVAVWQGQVALHDVRGGALWTRARVTAAGEGGAVVFHQLAFPGWRARIDGRPVPAGPAPEVVGQAMRPGFLLVPVPPGDHEVSVDFGPDGVAFAGGAVSSLTVAAGIGWVATRRLRRRPPPWPAVGAGVVLLGLLVLAGCGLAPRRLARFTSPATAAVVVNILDAAQAGQAQRSAPSGPELGPDRFLDVRSLTVWPQDRPQHDLGPRTRRWLFMHAPSEVAVEVTLPPDALFQSALAIDPGAWRAPSGDGVRFVVGVTPAGGAETIVLDATAHPRGRGEQRRWLDVAADLRPWAGQRVRLSLRTDPRQDPSFDWSGWAEPAVVRVDALAADRLLRSTADLRERVLYP